MRVAHLSLGDFRNYPVAEVSFAPGANLIVGRNGQGKTNLAEAISYFSSLRSHRVSSDVPLIRAGATTAIARLRLVADRRDVLLELQINREGPNRAQVNRNPVRPREVTRWFAAVAFVPEDLIIVRGEPSGRRKFLDDALVTRHPAAAGVLSDYDRALRQRNALLKSGRKSGGVSDSALQVWDDQLLEFGSQIILARRELLRDLTPHLSDGYLALVGEDHVPQLSLEESISESVSHETSSVSPQLSTIEAASVSRETIQEDYRRALTAARRREIERGVSLIGPHRDDLRLELNGLPVKGFASHGESWSFALSLKMALAMVLRDESPAGDPVIILDDVFAELDAGRRDRLMSAVADFEQIIVTAAVEADIPNTLDWNRIWVDAGTVTDDPEALSRARSAEDHTHDSPPERIE